MSSVGYREPVDGLAAETRKLADFSCRPQDSPSAPESVLSQAVAMSDMCSSTPTASPELTNLAPEASELGT